MSTRVPSGPMTPAESKDKDAEKPAAKKRADTKPKARDNQDVSKGRFTSRLILMLPYPRRSRQRSAENAHEVVARYACFPLVAER